MTNYEYLHSLSKENLAEWLLEQDAKADPSWVVWFENNFCNKCESEGTQYVPWLNEYIGCLYCEVHPNECRFFNKCPSYFEKIKLWLDSNTETTQEQEESSL